MRTIDDIARDLWDVTSAIADLHEQIASLEEERLSLLDEQDEERERVAALYVPLDRPAATP